MIDCVRIFLRRNELGLTQKEVADRAGISQQMYQRYESGARPLSQARYETVQKLAGALDISIIDFNKTVK